MKRTFYIVLAGLLMCCGMMRAQQNALQQRAAEEEKKGHVAGARSLYVQAFEESVAQGQTAQGVTCGTKAASLYYMENDYKEAFAFLHRVEAVIASDRNADASGKAAMRYDVAKVRLQMYVRLKKSANAREQLDHMLSLADASHDDALKRDALYHKAIYHYSFGQLKEGDAAFVKMAAMLTEHKEYDKVDEAYGTLIKTARKSGNAAMLARTYGSYMAWKDSVRDIAFDDEIDVLKKQIAAQEASLQEKDNMLGRQHVVTITLVTLTALLAGVLVLLVLVLLYFVAARRRQNKALREARESNARKAAFVGRISEYMEPALSRLDSSVPEVKALTRFVRHIQTYATLETDSVEADKDDWMSSLEETQMQTFSQALMDAVKDRVKSGVTLVLNVPHMTAPIHREYVTQILQHLLENAARYTPENGKITLEFRKRSPHKYQYIVTDSGEGIPVERHSEVFVPFAEAKDLTEGDGLGLPICRSMAQRMGGNLEIDAQYTKGARFVLELRA